MAARITWRSVDRDCHIVGNTEHGDTDLDLKTDWNQVVPPMSVKVSTLFGTAIV